MGNQFDELYLSNGGTDVLFDVLTLAGSAIATSSWERHLVLYFADGHRLGRGNAGFDLAELPWTGDCAAEKAFFLRLVDTALSGHGRDRLSYSPPYVDEYLTTYRAILGAYVPGPASPEYLAEPRVGGYRQPDWRVPPEPGRTDLCPVHKIFVGELGCRLCPSGH